MAAIYVIGLMYKSQIRQTIKQMQLQQVHLLCFSHSSLKLLSFKADVEMCSLRPRVFPAR